MIIKDTPYAAITDANGKFIIEKIPVGKWKFRFWQETLGYLREVTIGGETKKWKKGEVEVTISDNQTFDLGDIRVQLKHE